MFINFRNQACLLYGTEHELDVHIMGMPSLQYMFRKEFSLSSRVGVKHLGLKFKASLSTN